MTIIDKLKLDTYKSLVVINQPEDYHVFTERATTYFEQHDAIFIFVETIDEMIAHTNQIIEEQRLLEKGYLFFAYPKRGNVRYETSVHRDEIFPAMNVNEEDGYIGDSDLKFSRMVSMDDVFTVIGIKREKKKVKKTSSSPSQRVADYELYVEEVEQLLNEHPDVLRFYQNLTPGYRKDWARYIFSAKQETTRQKRQVQMIDICSQGYKSIDLYRQGKK